MKEIIHGFSRLTREEKIRTASGWVSDGDAFLKELEKLHYAGKVNAGDLEDFSENAISLYPLPFSVAPNFLLNGNMYHFPLVTEESSVVAAAAAAAKFWAERGGFHARVLGTIKTGQLHFTWKGASADLFAVLPELEKYIRQNLHHLTAAMEERGGGITGMELLDMTGQLENYYQLRISFETGDSMGANFINSCMEEAGNLAGEFLAEKYHIKKDDFEVIMAILSNFTPGCLVEVYVECKPGHLSQPGMEYTGWDFALKFKKAVDIALIDPYRAVTHNKGIYNGVDALMLATANDFRAVEANGHAYAARDGQYRGLSYVTLDKERFHFGLRIPVALGTVGGLTRLHPLAKWSFDMLGNPGASELMMMAATVGIANHFSAIKALITIGIQHGHLRMHMVNILSALDASNQEKNAVLEHFDGKTVSYSDIRKFLEKKRSSK